MNKIDSLKQLIDQLTNYSTDTDVWIDEGSAASGSVLSDNFSVKYRIIIDVNDRAVKWALFIAVVRAWYIENAANLTDEEIKNGFSFDVAITNLEDDYLQLRLDMKDVVKVTKNNEGEITDAALCC